MNWADVVRLAQGGANPPPHRVEKSDEEWRAQLSPDQYQVTRLAGTERPFSDPMCSLFQPGRYACTCCGTELFDSGSKFDSGTGWPSFGEPVADGVVGYRADNSHGMVRIEALCNVCDAHLGHVFPDGPPPSGLRFCINALSLQKQPA
ncbi:MAG: peptide-methionine (R)-S-oxide reductase MsrB [Sphingomonadales bacterium]|nr:peptide-methionine (R)-S-oxide reductase MsrB [Sphingomonadales bacterium]